MAKLKVAFVFNISNEGLTGRWYTNNTYRFFMKGLFDNPNIKMSYFPTDKEFDCIELAKFDVVIFYDIRKTVYKNIDKITGVSIARAPDSHDINEEWIVLCKTLNITTCFNHQSPKYARKFLPNHIDYHQIIFGITEELHQNPNFNIRKKHFILLPGVSNNSPFYILREKCKKLSYVHHKTVKDGFINDDFPILLGQYRAAIAACTVCSVYKYFELPACGCLTFMEVTEENDCRSLGFIDGKNAIFINERNYIKKFKRYLQNVNNPIYKKIAFAGREFVLREYSNKVQIQKLIDIMEKLV